MSRFCSQIAKRSSTVSAASATFYSVGKLLWCVEARFALTVTRPQKPRPSDFRRVRCKGLAIAHTREFAIVKGKPKWIAKGRERSLGRVGFGSLERELMRFTWCEGFGFAAAAALARDGASAALTEIRTFAV